MSSTDNEEARRLAYERRARLAAPVFLPAMWRVLDSLRKDVDGDLNADDLELEHIEVTSLDGTRLHMTACGEGDSSLFFVHGWTCNESIYRFQQRHFADDYRVYTLELRGHGASAIPESLDYHPERLAEDLEAAIRHVGPESFVIGGHSMGGFTAFKWFERFGSEAKGKLKGMAIIDSTGTDLSEGMVMGSAIKRLYPFPIGNVLKEMGRRSRISDMVREAIKETSAAYGMVRWGAFGSKPKGAHVEHVRDMVLGTHMTTLALAAKACLDFHYDYYLPKVDVPVMLLVGDRDKLTNREVNERTAALLPDARLKVFEGAGHCSLLERREDFNGELEAFLAEVFD